MKESITKQPHKVNFNNAGYFAIGLLLLAFLGFWKSYFSQFFDGTADFNFYFHFHAVIAVLWIGLLITQPILIKKKKFVLHRSLGKLSYVLVPLIFISVLLLAHSRINQLSKDAGPALWLPFKDLFILGTGFIIAIWNRSKMEIHARGMIVAGIVMIEPALFRLIRSFILKEPELLIPSYLITISFVYFLLIGLIVKERHNKKGRWIFPLTLGLFIFFHLIIILQIQLKPWNTFAEWFVTLPLT
jgi:hypothetical protein